MEDKFLERVKAMGKVRKLLALAAGNENQSEAENALNSARAIASKNGFTIQDVKPSEPLSRSEKLAAARRNMGQMGAAIKKAYPGRDDEDYTQYSRRETRRGYDEDRDQRSDEEEGY